MALCRSQLISVLAVFGVCLGMAVSGTAHAAALRTPRVIDEASNHQVITTHVGGKIVVVLHSTDWSLVRATPSGILRVFGSPVISAPPMTPTTPPGMGQGTQTSVFVARARGTSILRASRTSCGEAKLCLPTPRTFAVTVHVQ